MSLAPKINPSSPGILRQARRHAFKLRAALAIAAKRDSRVSRVLAALYESASVEGVDSRVRMKKGVVTFTEPPFRGELHQIYDWETLDESSTRELADIISWSLRESIREHRRKR